MCQNKLRPRGVRWQLALFGDVEVFIGKLLPEFNLTAAKCKNVLYFLTAYLRGLSMLSAVEDHRIDPTLQLSLLSDALDQMIEAVKKC